MLRREPLFGAGFEELGGDLPHEGQILRGGPVADLAVILVIGDVEDMMALVFHRPVRPDQIPQAGGVRRQTAQIIVIFLRRMLLGMPLAHRLAAHFDDALQAGPFP